MPVIIYPALHGANPVWQNRFSTSSRKLLMQCAPKEEKWAKEICASSFEDLTSESNVRPTVNGFIDTAIRAYNYHHHLEIRPDDVWLAILTQLSIYVNGHAEELRDMFVDHKGQKKLTIYVFKSDRPNRKWGLEWGQLYHKMTELMEGNIKDANLRDWILPDFTTTTENDTVAASTVMMASMQRYLCCGIDSLCGLPSVTLLGEKKDWEKIAVKAERLTTLGEEPKIFYSLLKPVLARFVKSFDEPESQEIVSFWQKIAHEISIGSGATYLSGWITAFCFWGNDAKCFFVPGKNPTATDRKDWPVLQPDDVRYHIIDTGMIPPGWASVPLTLDDLGLITETVLVAGQVGMDVSSSCKNTQNVEGAGLDTLSVVSGWWMYEKKDEGIV